MTSASDASRAQQPETTTEAEERKAPSPAWAVLYQHQPNDQASGPSESVPESPRSQPRVRPVAHPRPRGRRRIWPFGAAAGLTLVMLSVMLVLARLPGRHTTRMLREPSRSGAASTGTTDLPPPAMPPPAAPRAPDAAAQKTLPPPLRPAPEPDAAANTHPGDAAPAQMAEPNTAPSTSSSVLTPSAGTAHMAPPDHPPPSSPPAVAKASPAGQALPSASLPAQAAGEMQDTDTALRSRGQAAAVAPAIAPVGSPTPSAPVGSPTPSLLVVATGTDTLAALYSKIYRGLKPPPFATVAALNPAQPQPGDVLTFPPPANGWHTKRSSRSRR